MAGRAKATHADYAREAGLRIVPVDDLTITRIELATNENDGGTRYDYLPGTGEAKISSTRRKQIEALVLPPNWSDVRIATHEDAHLQAVGTDAAGRLQYRYHERWDEVRNRVKTNRLVDFGRALPGVREAVERDLRRRSVTRDTVAATAVRLIDRQLIRPGHEQYAANGTTGAATISGRHLKAQDEGETTIAYVGKSGKDIELTIRDKALRRRLLALKRENRGRLFAWKKKGERRKRKLGATDINLYLRRAAGRAISAKDFRTFGASAIALRSLCEALDDDAGTAPERVVSGVMKKVARRLRNTPTVARSSYVHPSIVDAFLDGRLDGSLIRGRMRDGLTRDETALMRFLETAP